MPGLKPEDFEILDSGRRQAVEVFDAEMAPLDLVLVVDTTGWWLWRGVFSRSLLALVGELRPVDRLAVVSMAGKVVSVLAPLTNDRLRVRQAIAAALRERAGRKKGGNPLLYDALRQAAVLFGGQPPAARRRIALVLTHNRADHSAPKMETTLRALHAAHVTVAGVVTRDVSPRLSPYPPIIISEGPPLPSVNILPESGTLDPITEETGGEILRYKLSETPDWFEVVGRLRRRYLAGFHAPPGVQSGEVRDILVRLADGARRACPDCVVRARSRYVLP